jgi:hypothetical protein
MSWNWLTPPQAWHGATYLWQQLALVWLVMFLGMKKAKRLEGWGERAQHEFLVLFAFWLLFADYWNWGWLAYRLFLDVPKVWMTGLVLTAVGIGIAICDSCAKNLVAISKIMRGAPGCFSRSSALKNAAPPGALLHSSQRTGDTSQSLH